MDLVSTTLHDIKGLHKIEFKVNPRITENELANLVSKQFSITEDIIIFVQDESALNWFNESSSTKLKDGMEIFPKLKSGSVELQKYAKKLEQTKHFILSDVDQRFKVIQGVKPNIKGFLKFELISGRDLAPMDPNGKSDPFAIFRLYPDIIFKSSTRMKTLNPEWNELFYIPIYEQSNLFIAVFDWDLASSNDFIGWAEVDVAPLMDYKPRDMWLQLIRTKKDKTQSRGFIHVKLQVKNKFEADKKIFGTSLIDIRQFQKNNGDDIPFIVDASIRELEARGLNVEGIGRISSSNVNELRQSIDRGDELDLSKADIHAVCGLLKLYFRELPEPLFPKFMYEDLIKCAADHHSDVDVLRPLLQKLPKQNRRILSRLLHLFAKIAANSAENKMIPRNLAIVFAPNILYPKEIDVSNLLVEGNLLCEILTTMIENCDSLGLDS